MTEAMTEAQAKKFLTTETKRWAHVIARKDNIKVVFEKSLGRHGGECGYQTIYYSRKTLLSNLDNKIGLTNLAIHEVIHFKIRGHGNDFQKEYQKWTGCAEPTMYVKELQHDKQIKVKPRRRGAGKTLLGKWKVDYIRMTRVPDPSPQSKTGYYIRQETVKTKPMTKTNALKIFRMASSKNYPAWLYQYVESAVAHGWKKIEYHARVVE